MKKDGLHTTSGFARWRVYARKSGSAHLQLPTPQEFQ